MNYETSIIELLDKLPLSDIDSEGTFKYILIQIKHLSSSFTQFYVRGYQKCPYHIDILKKFQQEIIDLLKSILTNKDIVDQEFLDNYLEIQSPGGGRIQNDQKEKKLFIYGFSVGLGKADHSITQQILQQANPNYQFQISDDGY